MTPRMIRPAPARAPHDVGRICDAIESHRLTDAEPPVFDDGAYVTGPIRPRVQVQQEKNGQWVVYVDGNWIAPYDTEGEARSAATEAARMLDEAEPPAQPDRPEPDNGHRLTDAEPGGPTWQERVSGLPEPPAQPDRPEPEDDWMTDACSVIHQHCGSDGSDDSHNDWVTDLASDLWRTLVRAPEPPAQPDRPEPEDEFVIERREWRDGSPFEPGSTGWVWRRDYEHRVVRVRQGGEQ